MIVIPVRSTKYVKNGWNYRCAQCGYPIGKNSFDKEGRFTDEENFCGNCGAQLDWKNVK